MAIISKKVKIENKLGMHLRAAAAFIRIAEQFKSNIYLEKDGKKANGKSIMNLMTLVASKGSYVILNAEGKDANEAVEALSKLIKNKFGEKE